MTRVFVTILSLLLFNSPAQASPGFMVVEGQLFSDAAGLAPVEAASVNFVLEVYSPGPEQCLLYRESHNGVNMSNSGGLFSLKLGGPSATRPGGTTADSNPLDTAFSNATGMTSHDQCLVGSDYTPGLTDGRKLMIRFNDGSGMKPLEMIDIGANAFALSAASLDGLRADDFLQIKPAIPNLTQSNLEWIFEGTRFTSLQNLITNEASYLIGPVDTTDIANNAITAEKLLPGLGTNGHVLGMSGGSLAWLPPGAPAADSVGGAQIVNGSVTDVDLAADSVTSAKIVNGTIVEEDLANNSITAAKLNAGAAGSGNVLTYNGTNVTWEPLPAAPVITVFGRSGPVSAQSGDYNAGLITRTATAEISATNVEAALEELGTEKVSKAGDTMTGALNIDNEQELRLSEADGNGAEYVGFRAPAALSGSQVWTLPASDGSTGQVLSTNGSGELQWAAMPAGSGDFMADGSVAMTQQFKAADGTIGVPAVSFGSDTDTGIYRPLADTIGFVTFGAERMSISSVGNVGIGIGTFAPNEKLVVAGNALVQNGLLLSDADNSNHVGFVSPAIVGSDTVWTLPDVDGTDGQVLKTNGVGVLSWVDQTSGADDLGNHTATTDLDLASKNIVNLALGSATAPSLSFDTDGNTGLFSPAADSLSLSTAGNEAMTINSSGYVGIGVPSPASLLQVAGGIQIANDAATCDSSKAGTLKYNGGVVSFCDGVGWEAFGTAAGGEVNTASNVTGSTGVGLYKVKNATNLEFKSLLPANNKVTISGGTDDVTIGINEANFNPGFIPNAPAGGILASNVQAAINELDSEKLSKDGAGAMTGQFKAATGTLATPEISFNGDIDTGLHRPAADTLSLVTGGSSRMVFHSSGNIGIGSTNPVANLDVQGVGRFTEVQAAAFINSGNTQTSIKAGQDLQFLLDEGENDSTNESFLFRVTDAGVPKSRMIIRAQGGVSIGNSATPAPIPTSPNVALQVDGAILYKKSIFNVGETCSAFSGYFAVSADESLIKCDGSSWVKVQSPAQVNLPGPTFDFTSTKKISTNTNCGGPNFNIDGLKDGETYELWVKPTGGQTCVFNFTGSGVAPVYATGATTKGAASRLFRFSVYGPEVLVTYQDL